MEKNLLIYFGVAGLLLLGGGGLASFLWPLALVAGIVALMIGLGK